MSKEVVFDVVDILESQYVERKFSLYLDNFFTSLKLMGKLKGGGHGATGTTRYNRIKKCPILSTKTFTKQQRGSEEHFLDEEGELLW